MEICIVADNTTPNNTRKDSTKQYRTEHYSADFQGVKTLVQNKTLQHNTEHYRTKQNRKEITLMKTETIEIKAINTRQATITINGTTDLILNKMNAVNERKLIDQRKDKAKSIEKSNVWEEIMTAVHWEKGVPTDFSEDGFKKALKENRPCISAFGLKKSFGDAVVRNEISTYATKFNASLNIIAPNQLVPISFAEHYVDEKLMSPKKGAPVLVHMNRFCGWSASFTVQFIDNVYSLEQIVNIINLAGFGLGIGSGRTSGYGRYSVAGVEA